MAEYRIAVIGGDGIGPEVVAEAEKVLQAAARLSGQVSFEFHHFPWGCDYYLREGRMMPADGLDILRPFDAIVMGAVGAPGVPDHVSLWGLLLPIRRGFDQYINLRPVKLLPGVGCPLAGKGPNDVDMIFIRENTEGEYSNIGGRLYEGTPEEVAVQTSMFTRRGVERAMRYGFELARREGRNITSITKSNALGYSMVLWDEVFNELKAEYPDVPADSLLVDAASMFMVRRPERFGVVVASNLFGDILTDLGAALQGSMGMAAGANLNPERRYPSMFEGIHGSAPDIAGKGIANPIATIWATKMMLDHLGHPDLGDRVLRAISAVVAEGKVLPPDLGGTARTSEVGDEICAMLERR